jgi:hypothetical protein
MHFKTTNARGLQIKSGKRIFQTETIRLIQAAAIELHGPSFDPLAKYRQLTHYRVMPSSAS